MRQKEEWSKSQKLCQTNFLPLSTMCPSQTSRKPSHCRMNKKKDIWSWFENYKNVVSRKGANDSSVIHQDAQQVTKSPLKLPETKRVKIFNALKEQTSVPSIISHDKQRLILN